MARYWVTVASLTGELLRSLARDAMLAAGFFTFIFDMAYRKLDNKEQQALSQKIKCLKSLFDTILERDTHAYSYDWKSMANDLDALNNRLLAILGEDEREWEKRDGIGLV